MTVLEPVPEPVPAQVLSAFGATSRARPLQGGQTGAWRSGNLVFKQVTDVIEARWRAELLARLGRAHRFRLARPVAAADGGWTVGGWSAWRWVRGRPADHRIREIAAAGRAFHQAIGHVGRPDFIDRRDDPWSHGDRMAWDEVPIAEAGPWRDELRVLGALREPIEARSQLMHPDLAGNVLFRRGQPPAIIDWPPYWRPAEWAVAIVAVDGLDTGRATVADALSAGIGRDRDHNHDHDEWLQLMIRAEIYRLGTKNYAVLRGRPLIDDKVHHRRTVRLLHELAT